MSSDKKINIRKWLNTLNFRKQSIIGKIILISLVFLFGSVLIYILLTISMNRWDELGIYSVWILFGWLFFIVLFYVSFKLISLLMHKQKSDKQAIENNESSMNSYSLSNNGDYNDDQSKT